MTTYSIVSPPNTSGIYALVNRITGQLYIGQTTNFRRRRQEWAGILTNKVGHASIGFMANVKDTNPEHWQFKILREAPASELNFLERSAIEKAKREIGELCLNSDGPIKRVIASGCLRKTKIIGPNGTMTYREAADFHNRSLRSVVKRVAKLRARNIFEIGIDALAASNI